MGTGSERDRARQVSTFYAAFRSPYQFDVMLMKLCATRRTFLHAAYIDVCVCACLRVPSVLVRLDVKSHSSHLGHAR